MNIRPSGVQQCNNSVRKTILEYRQKPTWRADIGAWGWIEGRGWMEPEAMIAL